MHYCGSAVASPTGAKSLLYQLIVGVGCASCYNMIQSMRSICDFSPISHSNAVYKLVSKLLANRLKLFLDKIAFVNQSAFTPGC